MATNPDNAIGTNGAYGGRTSVNAFNDVLSVFNGRGVIQGWELLPSAGMTITAGGDGSTRDVAIAEDNIGNKTTINNISEQPVPVDIPAAPASNSRIDLVVAYVDNPPQGASTATDNYGACGIIVVSGTAAASPTAPEEADIRSAITADGGAGTVAYYVVLGSVTVASGTTDIDSSMITNGTVAGITSHNIDFATFIDEFTSSVTLNETPLLVKCVKFGNIVIINYMGENKAHSSGTNLMTIPAAYRPVDNIWFDFGNSSCYGNVVLNSSNGQLNVNTINTSTADRVCLNAVYALT